MKTRLKDILSEEDYLLLENITSLINCEDYSSALKVIRRRLSQDFDISKPQDAALKAELAGFLIDIGSESFIKDATIEGLNILEKDRPVLSRFLSEETFEYNLGNAKHSLFNIERSDSAFQFRPETIGRLIEAKNHYWKAFQLFPSSSTIQHQLLVNLGTVLSESGRIVEALQYYDSVLENDPDFPQAIMNRTIDLLWLGRLSSTYSINLLYQAMIGFSSVANSTDIPASVRKKYDEQRNQIQAEIENRGHDITSVAHSVMRASSQAGLHSDYRNFCINNYLTLSEHSLYCKCVEAGRDDLAIMSLDGVTEAEFVPRMEMVLNRLKSEFVLARLLYYQAVVIDPNEWDTYDDEIVFTHQIKSEIVGPRIEMLRTSFRMCFGILDKIAYALCDLFDLADQREPLYFESFWRPRGKSLSAKQKKRWSKVNSIENSPFLGLYSQATDLNSAVGEWKQFKSWRNSLEHRVFVLGHDEQNDFDLQVMPPDFVYVEFDEFRTRTLHLLQLTRSAIFNYTLCVRTEAFKVSDEDD